MSYVSMRWKQVLTRKPHECFGCYRKFPPRTEMIGWASICDGDWGSGYCCLVCEELMKHIESEDYGYPWGFVSENLDPGETPESMLQRILKQKQR